MIDTLIAIFFVLIIFFGIPISILLIRDRSKLVGGIVTRIFGLIVLLSGVAFLALIIYDMIKSSKAIGEIGIKYLIWSIFPLGFIVFGWKWLSDSGPGIEDHKIDFESPELITSIQNAKETLPCFINILKKNADSAFIKFPLKADQEIFEHVWAYVHHYGNGLFNVSIVNKPRSQNNEYENRLTVAENDVEDWQIIYPDGNIKGAYSYIGALKYLKRKGIRFNKTLQNQQKRLIDAEPGLSSDR